MRAPCRSRLALVVSLVSSIAACRLGPDQALVRLDTAVGTGAVDEGDPVADWLEAAAVALESRARDAGERTALAERFARAATEHPAAGVRAGALRGLAHLAERDPAAVASNAVRAAVEGGLADPRPAVKVAAASAAFPLLGGEPAEIAKVARLLDRREPPEVRSAALRQLAGRLRAGDSERAVLEAVVDCTQSIDPGVSWHAGQVLAAAAGEPAAADRSPEEWRAWWREQTIAGGGGAGALR